MNTGLYALCSREVDKTGKIKQKDDKETIQCCLDICRTTYKHCEGKENCDFLRKDCYNVCRPAGWNMEKVFFPCVEKSGCGLGIDPNLDCMKQKRDEILSCCAHDCIPTSTNDCNARCEQSFDETVNPSLVDPLFNPNIKENFVELGDPNSVIIWIVFAICVGMVIVSLGLLDKLINEFLF